MLRHVAVMAACTSITVAGLSGVAYAEGGGGRGSSGTHGHSSDRYSHDDDEPESESDSGSDGESDGDDRASSRGGRGGKAGRNSAYCQAGLGPGARTRECGDSRPSDGADGPARVSY